MSRLAPTRFALSVLLAVALSACGAAAPAPAPVAVNVPPAVAPSPTPVATQAAARAQPPSEEDAAVPVLTGDPTWGSRVAPVTLVFFGDFQCPFTARAAHTVRALQEKYGPTALRVAWKNDPLAFHPQARLAASTGEAVFRLAGDAFWPFHALAFDDVSKLTPEALDGFTQAVGVDVARVHELASSNSVAAKIDADLALAKRLGVSGTPAFFVNGVSITGAQPLEAFVTVVDAQLDAARTRIAGGTPPELVYAALAHDNFGTHAAAPEPVANKPDTTTVFRVPVAGAPSRGSDGALVTIVEFGDFQCPFTRRVEPTLAQLRALYGDKLRVVWRDEPLPFHPRARPAAELAREARAQKGLNAFWAAHDGLLTSPDEDPDLAALASAMGLDARKALDAVARNKFDAAIDEDRRLAETFQANGTPHFFVNGRRFVGAQPLEAFRAIVDEEIVHAQAVLAKGTPRRGSTRR